VDKNVAVESTSRHECGARQESRRSIHHTQVEKVLWSAMHNLINHAQNPVSEDEVQDFRISKIYADQGPTLKRIQPHARGRAFPIKKRISHITIELDDLQ